MPKHHPCSKTTNEKREASSHKRDFNVKVSILEIEENHARVDVYNMQGLCRTYTRDFCQFEINFY